VQRQGHIANRSLSAKDPCAFVRAAFGKAAADVATSKQQPVNGGRPIASLGDEDRMHPGEGGA
jgi:hypothetical protein